MLSCATTHSAVCELKHMRRSSASLSLSLKAALRFKGTGTWHFFFSTFIWTELSSYDSVLLCRCEVTELDGPETTETRVPIQLWRNLFLGRIYFGYNFPLFGRGTVRIIMFSKPDKSFILFHGQKLWSFTVVAQLTVKSLKCPRRSAFILLSSELPLTNVEFNSSEAEICIFSL